MVRVLIGVHDTNGWCATAGRHSLSASGGLMG